MCHQFLRCVLRLGALAALVSLVSGCATVTGSETQTISVETRTKAGEFVEGVACQLSNDKGEWSLRTPGSALVTKSAADLFVRCTKEEHDLGTAVAVARVNGAIFGNILFGGVIGAVIDHSQGTGYDYAATVAIEMGSHRTIDLQDGNAVIVATQPLPPSQAGAKREGAVIPTPAPENAPRKTTVTLDELKDLLPP